MNALLRAAVLICGMCLFAHGQLTRQANTTLTLPANLPAATGYVTENALGTLTFALPMCTAHVPGETNRLFVAERGSGSGASLIPGAIQVVTNLTTTPVKTQYLSLTSLLAAGETLRTDGENGFLSLVLHPNFATNGTFFVYFSMQVTEGTTPRLFQRLHKVVVTNPAATTATIASHTRMLTVLDPATNHNGGDLHFGPDGYLYLSLGDGGGANDQHNNARFINHQLGGGVARTGFWGQLLRLDVDLRAENLVPNAHVQNSTAFPSAVQPGTYKIPADNPFIGYTRWHSVTIDPATVRTEIYATGLRNPFRFSFDPPSGRLFLADVGQNIWEEVNIIVKGGDYGWSWREGDHVFNSPPAPTTTPPPAAPGDPPGTGFNPIAPIFEYDQTNSGAGDIWGESITGGMVMRGDRLPELFGAYIYADHNSAQIVALRQNGATWTGQIIATDTNIADFGIDPRNDDLLLCDLSSGQIRRLARSGTSGSNPPALLSATGAFSSLNSLTPNTGIVPYEPNADLWSDYASKQRWFSIKNLTDDIGFSVDGNWSFPTGMVWVKHFDIETERGNPATKRKLETRFLVKTATDIYGLSYKWRADQTDADLVPEEGITELIAGSLPAQTWRYPSRSECRTCHNPVGGFALSFNTRQLNRDHVHGALTQNQIAALSEAGYFTAPVSNVHSLPSLARPTDTTKSLESRVRAYLSVNCVHCHQPGGATPGLWDARMTTPTDAANIINGTLLNTFGDPDDRFVVPGQTGNSMLLKRLQGVSVPRMPPLLTTERDVASEQLVTQWINDALPTRQSFTQWQTTNFGSPAAPEAAPGADPDFDGQTNGLEYLQSTPPQTTQLPTVPGLTIVEGDQISISFLHPANRSAIIETSVNLVNWTPWNVTGNAPFYPASDTPRTLVGPKDAPARHFRLTLGEL